MILSPPTDTDKGIANLEIEDLRKDNQVLENGKGEGHTSTPPFTPYFSPRKTRGQRQREQKKVKKEPKTPKQSRGPRGKGSMVQSWFNQ